MRTGRSRVTGTVRRARALAALAAVMALQIGLLSALAGRVPAGRIALAGAVAALAASLATAYRAPRSGGGMGRDEIARAAVAGALGVFAAPYLVAANRMSDAPPGSELVFFAAVLWGGLGIIAAAGAAVIARRPAKAVPLCAGAVAAVIGAAGVLANWERPSCASWSRSR
jgi:hypothetical protein